MIGDMKKFLPVVMVFNLGISMFVVAVVTAFSAKAEPPAPNCDTATTPPCAPVGMDPNVQCAITAYITWTPCNWWNIKVPVGTPGSL